MYTILVLLCNLSGPCTPASAVSRYHGTEEVNANQCLILGQTFAAQLTPHYPNMKVVIGCLPVEKGKEARMAIPFLAITPQLV